MDDGCLGARACLDAVKPAWDAAVAAGNPVGMGLGLKNSGLGNGANEVSRSTVRFDPDGTIEVRHCWTEMGQGIHTVARQVAVEELGVEPDRIKVVVDTRELGAGQTTGSRGTSWAPDRSPMPADAMAGGCEEGVEYEGVYVVDWTNSINDGLENPVIHSTFGYAAQLVELDSETGEIAKVVAARRRSSGQSVALRGPDRGRRAHGAQLRAHRGLSCDEHGKPLNETLRSLDIIRPKDMPPTEVILVESPDPNSPWHQGCRRDRSCSHGRRGCGSAARPRRRVASRGADAHRAQPRAGERLVLSDPRVGAERGRASTSRLRSAMIRS